VTTPIGEVRHEARERALAILYEASMKSESMDDVLASLEIDPDPYARQLVISAAANHDRALELIEAASVNWDLERISLIDRLVMELAIGEMLIEDRPPRAVILDEAVELAKIYSTEGSGSFVNGILSSVANTLAIA
jgi:transcription antitermination protein NusB